MDYLLFKIQIARAFTCLSFTKHHYERACGFVVLVLVQTINH